MPSGFTFNGVRAGIKPSGRSDLAVVLAPAGASAAALFTTNRMRAAPVVVSEDHLRSGRGDVRAVLINAGCANAATGPDGVRRCIATATALAERIGCLPDQVLVASTGVIGVPLPDARIVAALDALVAGAGADADALTRAAEAILTTDTHPKIARAAVAGGGASVVGFAKGAGMIHPSLAPAIAGGDPPNAAHATMIAVLVTDAAAAPAVLERLLLRGCDRSFHRITIDGDTSTNDAVFALASGAAGAVAEDALAAALHEVMRTLALAIARDGEGARRLVTVRATGAASAEDALKAARTVASSLLVRTAIAGGDPNWGRIAAAIGRSGALFDAETLRIAADGVVLYERGAPSAIDPHRRGAIFRGESVLIEIDLGAAPHRAPEGFADEFHTCDLTEEYVRVNAEYTT
ncbi:MAG TPA: bifunctional glutamate N-acetyltransferase/amino-acid acetyltransferase ArgJ [Phycisphaerales bacterium]|nr:bifunctional glutamate N-acetyltransferase/amino-acid acetyltransferase ArgJ [Phycisphaerales bacterium]HMP37186.1 bifunctional glutamate N-acetyltransferase/amino-acid acetyltransferase ArgJ [Phycisphaerales bacterium]